jgi:hypothetical protein
VSSTVRLGVSRQAGSLRGSDDGRSWYSRSGFISDIAGETAGGLAMHGRRDHKHENADNREIQYFVGSCIGWASHRFPAFRVNHSAFHRRIPFDKSGKVALASVAYAGLLGSGLLDCKNWGRKSTQVLSDSQIPGHFSQSRGTHQGA